MRWIIQSMVSTATTGMLAGGALANSTNHCRIWDQDSRYGVRRRPGIVPAPFSQSRRTALATAAKVVLPAPGGP